MIHRLLLWLLGRPGPGRVVPSLVAALLLTVSFTPPSFAQSTRDLVASNPYVTRSVVGVGVSFTLSATMEYRGTGASTPTSFRFLLSNNATITPSDTPLAIWRRTRTWFRSGERVVPMPSVSISTPGIYWVGACIDAARGGEITTANNCTSGVRVEVSPVDLLVAASPSVRTPAPGAPFEITATVRNASTRGAAARATTLRYFISNSSSIAPTDTELATDAVVGLAPGGSASYSATISIPTAETFWVGACVDTVDGELPKAATNNCSDSLRIDVGSPNLVFDDISVSTTTPAPGVPFTIAATLRNTGTGASPPAPSVEIHYYHAYGRIWTGSTSTLDIHLTHGVIDEIAPGASAQYISPPVSLSRPGIHWVGACTISDPNPRTIREAWIGRRLNECSFGRQITIAVPQPDLTVDSVSVADSTVEVGASFTLEATVRNVGSGATDAATTLRYYRSTDATITPTDTAVATDAVAGLAPGGFAPNSATLSITTAGDYWVGACVDTVTYEAIATNNCSSGVPITVHPFGSPDLAVDRVRVTEFTEEDDRVSFTITATVQNAGSGASPASALRYYRAADARTTPSGTRVAGDAEVEGLAPAAEVQGLAPEATSTHTVTVSLPAAESYWVVACVDTVTDEFRTTNNCSSGVRVTDNDGIIGALMAIQQLLLLSP